MDKICRILHKNNVTYIDGYMGDKKNPMALICNVCSMYWYSYPYEIRIGRKCPYCHESSGEKLVRQWLEYLSVPYYKEVYTGIGLTRFDFMIRDYSGRYCIIEFDGKQHTEYIKYFHKSKRRYNKYKKRDIEKMNHAIKLGYRILRISYKSEKYIGYWLRTLLTSDEQIINV